MSARVLVVDDLASNVKLLEARLSAEYFEVRSASNGHDALRLAGQGACDIVILDILMPGLNGLDVCRRLKSDPQTSHIPVIIVTALDQPADRMRGLEAGADDYLTKPVDEVALIARVRSLARIKVVVDELLHRAVTSTALGLPQSLPILGSEEGTGGRLLLVEDRVGTAERLVQALSRHHRVDVEPDPNEALFRSAAGGYELVVVSLNLQDFDGLRLCSQLRSLERTRSIPILVLADPDDRPRILRALDIGVNDYLIRPVARDELAARVVIQLRRKRYSDRLQAILQESIQAAVVDSLTGLHNRRYLESHLASLIETAADRSRPLSLMILDLDHFKQVNDTYGHEAGDEVLRAFAGRLRSTVRGADLVCRLGGEEFIIVMPETSLEVAGTVAERVRQAIGGSLFSIEKGARQIPVTVSIGIAERRSDKDPERLLRRADRALYRSKADGRNRVCVDAA